MNLFIDFCASKAFILSSPKKHLIICISSIVIVKTKTKNKTKNINNLMSIFFFLSVVSHGS